MIKFFRNIRKKLIEQSKVRNTASPAGRYFFYAIGEIILVVIGILIALQINNWNTERINSIEEGKILSNLNSEFKLNRANLGNDILETEQSIEIGKQIMDLIGADETILMTKNTDSLLYAIFEYGRLQISENSILEIIQSGKFQNLSNDKLKPLIIGWTQKKNDVQRTEEQAEKNSEDLITYLYKRYPVKNIDAYGVLNWQENSKLEINKYLIFKDIEFENLVDDLLYKLLNYKEKLTALQTIIDAIIIESENTK
jgi:hypothetical protein